MFRLATNTSAFQVPGPVGSILSITRSPSSRVPLPCWAFACCFSDALTTRPHRFCPHGAITITIAPFFHMPSRLLLAIAEAGAQATASPASAQKSRFILSP
jgi:hypothetical protein